MTLTGLALAKVVASGVGIAAAAGATAVATGNAHALMMAVQHVPTWTHAHSVLTNLGNRMPWNHSH